MGFGQDGWCIWLESKGDGCLRIIHDGREADCGDWGGGGLETNIVCALP